METPEPEDVSEPEEAIEDDDSSGFEITEGESTSIAPSIFGMKTDPSLTPLDQQDAALLDRTNADRLPETPPVTAHDQVPADEEFPDERTGVEDPARAVMFGELEQIDFFIDQGLPEDARNLLDEVAARFPPTPLLDDRRRRIVELEQSIGPGAVPVAPGAVSHLQQGGTGSISPKAMVAAGGEMDLESHRDLGIGYKDMGLFDAAIREFSLLVKDPRHEVFALTMIGECHEFKGAMADAVAYYKKALNKPAISDDEATALYFQLGSVFQTMGETNEALYFFEKVMKRDASFRDVRKRVSDLRGGEGGRGFDALLGKNHR
jgi:tetratricopeptide (TPR) repeat protein